MNRSFEKLVFVVGCPRSGTTKLTELLNSHPEIFGSSETHFFNINWGFSFLNNSSIDLLKNISEENLHHSLKDFYEHYRIKDFLQLASIDSFRVTQLCKVLLENAEIEVWQQSHKGTARKRTSSRLRRTNDRNVLQIHEDHEDDENAEIEAVHHGTARKRTSSRLRRTNDRSVLQIHEDHEDDENAEIEVCEQSQHEENILVYTESNLEKILEAIKNSEANLIIVDSIQALYNPNLDSVPGNVSQIKECCSNLTRIAKTFNVPIFIVGHINKDGDIAGPKILEHMVDTVLQFEMIKDESLRILRSIKNRFGSTDELAVFEMRENGLSDVSDPSQIFLNQRAGGIVTVIKEGRRALLVEVQSLVIYSDQHNPRRMANGIDFTRLHQILAIMEKYLSIPLGKQDVYVNVAGGLSIKEPASDLAIALSILEKSDSSANDFIALGELGLGGEIRQVSNIELRLKEAQKLGFTKAIIPTLAPELKINLIQLKIEIIEVSNIQEAATAFRSTKHSSSYQERVIERSSSSPRRTNDRSVLKQSTEKCLK
jgi:DNA repair protein RadA